MTTTTNNDTTTTITLQLDRLHVHSSTENAYNATQCDDTHQRGDTLHVPAERVVGIVDTWPVAVTQEHGELHSCGDWRAFLERTGMTIEALRAAVHVATVHDYPLQRELAELLDEQRHYEAQEREHEQHPDLSEDYPGQRISAPGDAPAPLTAPQRPGPEWVYSERSGWQFAPRVAQLSSLLDDFATVQQQQEREHFYKAITVRYHGATNHRGARYSASDSDRNRCSVSIDHAYSDGGNARRAAEALCSKMHWPGQLAGGQQRPGVYVFVFVAGGAR